MAERKSYYLFSNEFLTIKSIAQQEYFCITIKWGRAISQADNHQLLITEDRVSS
jgi:hypothetical protein